MADLEKAILIAVQAHKGQKDRSGHPYILHPLRVMFRLHRERDMIVGVLHDIIEDTEWTLEELKKEGFSDEIVDAVNAMTRRTGETYWDFVARAKKNTIARKVKIVDLEDNMDVRRMTKITEEDQDRLKRYHKAWVIMQSTEK
jgi:(p)ppGpp synthase/HD superfamily hydrolase